MPLPSPLTLPATADMHVHLRQDAAMLTAVVPSVRAGGADVAYVMPNLVPPLTTVAAVQAYHSRLVAIDPSVTYLMTLYLHPSITPATVTEAAASGIIRGIKAYPAGVTTNSAAGVVEWEQFWPLFGAMEAAGLVLNLHGEVPEAEGVTVFNAEERFLPTLHRIHAAFPKLRIVLEHCTSAAALEAVRKCGDTVACTVTAHHLWITADAWKAETHGAAHNWCKPAAKTEADRKALVQAVVRGGDRVFFGSDSAPHDQSSKLGDTPAAGCFTQGWTTQLVVGAVEEALAQGWLDEDEITEQALANFLSNNARKFYGVGEATGKIILERKGEKVSAMVKGDAEGEQIAVVPFRAGEDVWSLHWA